MINGLNRVGCCTGTADAIAMYVCLLEKDLTSHEHRILVAIAPDRKSRLLRNVGSNRIEHRAIARWAAPKSSKKGNSGLAGLKSKTQIATCGRYSPAASAYLSGSELIAFCAIHSPTVDRGGSNSAGSQFAAVPLGNNLRILTCLSSRHRF